MKNKSFSDDNNFIYNFINLNNNNENENNNSKNNFVSKNNGKN
jgi:hypothetical protein